MKALREALTKPTAEQEEAWRSVCDYMWCVCVHVSDFELRVNGHHSVPVSCYGPTGLPPSNI